VDYFRSRARHEELNDPFDTVEDIFEAESSETAEASRDLGKFSATLPDKQRLPIMHVKLERHSVAEAAQMSGLSESAVKVGIHRELKVLAAKLRVRL
jgi:RNA polymerase sigma-70 factor (ECF subfamily)